MVKKGHKKNTIIYCKKEDEKINKLLKHNTENIYFFAF